MGDINHQCLFHRSKIIIFQACNSSQTTNSSSPLPSTTALSSAETCESAAQNCLPTSSSSHRAEDTLLPHPCSAPKPKKPSTAASEPPHFAPEITKLLRECPMDLRIAKQRLRGRLLRSGSPTIDSSWVFCRHRRTCGRSCESRASISSRASI